MKDSQEYVLLIVLGLMLIIIPVIKASFEKKGLPALVGFIFLGLLTRLIDFYFPFITVNLQTSINFLAQIGIFILLFHVGLKSNIKGLIKKLPDASLIWISDVVFNFFLGYLASRYLINLPVISSLVIATALSATSVVVSSVVWKEKGKLNTSSGQLLIDIAELDDLSGVLLFAVLLSIIPVIQGSSTDIFSVVSTTISITTLKLVIFIGFCYLFAHYVESTFTQFNCKWSDPKMGLTISVLGVGLAIAAIAGYLGFSLAIGALFAGLAFSRDPHTVHTDTRSLMLYEFFTPFFFINIGMQINPTTVTNSISLAASLFIIAITGKIISVSFPALRKLPKRNALLLGVSMVPRAEITILIIYQASLYGEYIVTPEIYAAVVFVVISTSIVSPIVIRKLMKN